MKFRWALILLVMLVGDASARLGETQTELEARYGPVMWSDEAERMLGFLAQGFMIYAHLDEFGQADFMGFRKEGTFADPITDTELDVLLKANAGGVGFKIRRDLLSIDREWRNAGGRVARYMSIRNMFWIATRDGLVGMDAAQKKKERDALKGF